MDNQFHVFYFGYQKVIIRYDIFQQILRLQHYSAKGQEEGNIGEFKDMMNCARFSFELRDCLKHE